MHAETLKELLHAEPFYRFTIRTVTGTAYVIEHPEAAWLTRGGRTLYINLPEGEGERVHILDTVLIERIEPSKAPMPG
jgi:hypothetical protein